MSRPDRTRRRRLLSLVSAGFLLGAVASPGAVAQTDPAGVAQPDTDQFGGFIASARSNGIQVTYDSPGLLPTGSPVIQLSVPESLATLNSGPTGYALSSFAFPGPLIADIGAALAAGGTETGIPPYPVRSEAFFPAGPTTAENGDQGLEMKAVTEFADSRARTSFTDFDLAPAGSVGSIISNAQSVIDGDQVVSRARTTVSGVSLLAGLIRIESVVTELVATSNGSEAATTGGTTVNGVTVLGLPATIDADGISFAERPTPEPEAGPVDDALGGLLDGALDPVTGGLQDVVAPLNDLLAEIGAVGDDALQQLFDATGIEVEILDATESVDGGGGARTASGLSITLNYDGANTPLLTDLLALLPSDELPSDNLGPVPFSPQAIAKLLDKQHIIGFAIAPASVSTEATPAFEFEPSDVAPASPTTSPSSGSGTTGSSSSGGDFETATPELPPPPEATVVEPTPAASDAAFPFGNAIPALVIFAVVLGSPFFAAGSSRLADNTLAAVGSGCPEGLDLPPEEAGS